MDQKESTCVKFVQETFFFELEVAIIESELEWQGGFQLVDLIIIELEYHMTCQSSIPLIGWNYSIQTGEQIL